MTPQLKPITELASAKRASRVRYQILGAACSLAIVVYIQRVGFARALPKISNDLALSDQYVGWLSAAFLIAYGVFEVPWGALGDRFGVRHLLTLVVMGSSLLTGFAALVVFLPNVWLLPFVCLVVLRFLFGALQAGAFPVLARMLTDWMPMRERGSAQGFIWMSARIGGMIIPIVLGWLMVRAGNWQTPLWIVAGLGLLWCAAFWPWFRNRPEEKTGVNAGELELIASGRVQHDDTAPLVGGIQPAELEPSEKPARLPRHETPWRRMLRSRNVWALCLMYGCSAFAATFFITLLPTYLERHRHLSDQQTDWLSSLPFAFGALACLTGGFLSDRMIRYTGNRKWGRRLSGTIGMTLGAVGWFALNWSTGLWALAFWLAFIFFCNDLTMGPAWASCADIGERYAGTVAGAMNMIGSFAGALGNILAGYLFEAKSPELLFVIYACSFGLGAICWQGVDVTKRLVDEKP